MKKILKVSGIVLAVIFVIMIIGFAVITAFFPGLFVYMNAKKEYPHINDKIGEYSYYDTEVPADFVKPVLDANKDILGEGFEMKN